MIKYIVGKEAIEYVVGELDFHIFNENFNNIAYKIGKSIFINKYILIDFLEYLKGDKLELEEITHYTIVNTVNFILNNLYSKKEA